MYRIQSSPKKQLVYQLSLISLLGVKLKETLTITREASSEIYVPQYFKQKIKKSFIAIKVNIQYFLLYRCFTYNFFYFLECSKYFMNCLWTFVLVPTRKSSAAKFTARKELEWNDFSVVRAHPQMLWRQKNVIDNANKSILSQDSAYQNYGPAV